LGPLGGILGSRLAMENKALGDLLSSEAFSWDSWAIIRRSQALLGASWGHLGGLLRRSWGRLGPLGGLFGADWLWKINSLAIHYFLTHFLWPCLLGRHAVLWAYVWVQVRRGQGQRRMENMEAGAGAGHSSRYKPTLTDTKQH